MKILIIGDSFAADWTVKYKNRLGWPNLLAKDYSITNLAEAGVSEYSIFQQSQSVNILDFDFCIVSHTSPNRVHTKRHPIHFKDKLHSKCSLIFSDIDYHLKKNKSTALQTAYNWFKYHYDQEFQNTIYTLFKEKITQTISETDFLEVSHLPNVNSGLNYYKYYNKQDSYMNHFSYEINLLIYNDIKNVLNHLRS